MGFTSWFVFFYFTKRPHRSPFPPCHNHMPMTAATPISSFRPYFHSPFSLFLSPLESCLLPLSLSLFLSSFLFFFSYSPLPPIQLSAMPRPVHTFFAVHFLFPLQQIHHPPPFHFFHLLFFFLPFTQKMFITYAAPQGHRRAHSLPIVELIYRSP